MTEILIFFLGVSLFLYVLLGGADFGAGIVELFTGKKGIQTISKAIAPIWEANHIWIIVVVVILFNGFPKVYTSISTYLYIPLLLTLIGIIIRGTSFTFRYYDVPNERINEYYTRFFRVSSILTPFFFGMILGAIISGRIPPKPEGSFYEVFMYPWFNFFSVSTGIFVTILFAWLASVYLIGEHTQKNASQLNFKRAATFLFLSLIASGLFVFVTAEFYNINLFRQFWNSPVSISSIIVATILVPILWKNIHIKNILWTRILAGAVTFLILTGWFASQYPVLVYISNGENLTVPNSIAPEMTVYYLVYALIVGILIIFPSIAYLFKVFKFDQT